MDDSLVVFVRKTRKSWRGKGYIAVLAEPEEEIHRDECKILARGRGKTIGEALDDALQHEQASRAREREIGQYIDPMQAVEEVKAGGKNDNGT